MVFFRAMHVIPWDFFEKPFLSCLYISAIFPSSYLSCFQSVVEDGLCFSPVPSLSQSPSTGLHSLILTPFMFPAQFLFSFFCQLPEYLQCYEVRWKVAVKAPFAAVLPSGVLVKIPWISAEVSSSPSFVPSEELESFRSSRIIFSWHNQKTWAGSSTSKSH